jgi:ubiquinone/menaquinone biosynthesis C-methylase UbiE
MDAAPQNENTYIFDPESAQEMARLINQDRFTTRMMGGPLAGLPELPPGAQVLDLACGPGGWALEVAHERPDVEVCGVDISHLMIDYANTRVRSQQLVNVSFGVMDIRQPLDFGAASFDLVNARFLYVALKRDLWPPLIAECKRLLRPGGILRLTEVDDFGVTSSAAYEQFSVLNMKVLWRLGYGFSSNGRSFNMSMALLRMCREAGLEDLYVGASIGDYSAQSDGWADFYHNGDIAVLQTKQQLIRSGQMSAEEFDQLYQQMVIEMHAKDFTALWHSTSVWGRAPTID